jgi:hypothetical protein
MPFSAEKAQPNNYQQEFSQEEEREITQKWYNHASFEGRTKLEFSALREKVRKSTTLDFVLLKKDQDYSRLIYENPFVADFLTDQTLTDLNVIYEDRADLGISDEQFEKLLTVFGKDVVTKFHEEITTGRIIKKAYRQFTPEELARHSNETFATMKKEIDLQEKDISHRMLRPPLLPRKKTS